MMRVRVKVSDWTFRAVQGLEVLTINPAYFRLRRPLERRIYELARKHVGDRNGPFVISLAKLRRKVGSNSPGKKFKFFLKQIAEDGHIPDYDIALRDENVVFSARRPGFAGKTPVPRPHLPSAPSPDLLEKARRVAPGLDIYALYSEWKAFSEKQSAPPRSIDAAFLGFCKRRLGGQ